MKWLNDKELTKPGWYWKCWKGGDGKYYPLRITEIWQEYINDVNSMDYDSSLYYYGPLEMPPPPTGDVWGV